MTQPDASTFTAPEAPATGVKRALDVAVVLACAPVWVPLLTLAATAILVDSGRPVLFVQLRMGLRGRRFTIFKLRTMKQGEGAPQGALFRGWTYEGDPRVTRIGRLLRRYRLDELPQMLNVLRGDMSLVGPRPEPWDVALALGTRIPGYHERHRVRPGLTGLCQISDAYRDFGTIERSRAKLAYDLDYVRRATVRLDMFILRRTVRVVLAGTGMA